MLRLKRHIVTEITEIFFAVIIALILIMISFQFAKLLSEAASGKIVGSAIYKLVALQTVNLFVLLTPFAFFIATIIGLSKLANDNELIAMKSIGYSDYRLYQALFTVAIPLALLTLFLTLNTLPKILSLSYQLKHQAKKESELSVIQPGNFRNLGNNVTIFVADVNDKEFSKFFVWQRNNGSQSITVAQTGEQFEKAGKRLIELKHGSRYSWDSENSHLMQFEKLVGKLPDIKSTSRSERLKSTSTEVLLKNPSLINRVEIQRRLAPGISILLLALFAPLLVQFNPRENKYGKFVIAILAYALYSNTQIVFQTLTVKELLPVYLGLHTSHIIVFTFTIFIMYRKSDWRLSRRLLRRSNG